MRLNIYHPMQLLIASLMATIFSMVAYADSNTEAQLQSIATNAPRLNFSLFSIQNDDIVQLSQLPPKMTLVNFWRADCPPCVKELPFLIEASAKLNIRLITVAVQSLSETQNFWATVPGNPKQHIALLGPTNPTGILRRFGNKSGAIPHSVLLNNNNQVCSKRTGEINAQWLETRVLTCETSQDH